MKEMSIPRCLYQQYPLPIKKAKADDVQTLAVKCLPAQHQQFYAIYRHLPELAMIVMRMAKSALLYC